VKYIVKRIANVRGALAGLALASALAAAGCGGASGTSAGSGSSGGSSQSGASAELSKGTLVIGLSRQLTGLDPASSTGSVDGDGSIERAVDASLTQYNPQQHLVGDLATSWKRTSPNQWTFKLRPGAGFQDGSPLNAAAVAWNFNRMLAKNTTLGNAPEYQAFVKSVSAPNPTTLVINTKGPYLDLPDRMAAFFVISPKFTEQHHDNPSETLASGPYEIKSYNLETGATLVPNPHWWGAKDTWKKVVYQILQTEAQRVQAAQANEIDVAIQYDPRDLKLFSGSSVYTTGSEASAWNNTLRINENIKPLNNKLVRQAINYAINKQAIIKNVLGVNEQPLQGQVVSKPYDLLVNPALKAYPYDPAKAKQLLAQAGYPHGFSTELGLSSGTYVGQTQIAQVIAQELGQVGIKVKITQADFASWVERTESTKPSTPPPLYYIGYTSGYKSPSARLEIYSDSDAQSHYDPKDTTYDNDVAKLTAAATPAQQRYWFDKATAEFREEAHVIFLWPQPLTYVINKQLSWVPRPEHWLDPQDFSLKSS
jgi:peptide/nickel transport system substrate-binding protein